LYLPFLEKNSFPLENHFGTICYSPDNKYNTKPLLSKSAANSVIPLEFWTTRKFLKSNDLLSLRAKLIRQGMLWIQKSVEKMSFQ
jgi:hypothetical protein